LEGAINNVRQYARVAGRPVDMSLVKEALGDFVLHVVRSITLADVDKAVCIALRLPQGTLQSKGRSTRAVAHSRMVAIFLCRKHTAATFSEIAKYFGVRNHSTAVNAEKTTKKWLDANQVIAIGDRNWPAKDLIDRIERELQK
jgi:chromosomal replication initiator protein